MRIIHCADLHLDSALSTHLKPALAEKRRNEILLRFQEMIRFAVSHNVRLILIAGDLFDSDHVSHKTKNVVLAAISQAAQIDFLYLTGNHDELSAFDSNEIPANMKIFSKKNPMYRYGVVTVTGITDLQTEYELQLNAKDINIVMMHGQVTSKRFTGTQENQAHEIYLSSLIGKNIDYLALGHIHSFKQEKLDQRGSYTYCGCLEPRGFDEAGEKGFVYLETAENQQSQTGISPIRSVFVPFAKREAHILSVDVTGIETTPQVCDAIDLKTKNIADKDLVKVILKGAVDADIELNLSYISQRFTSRFFAFRIEDESTLTIDIDEIMKEDSMKGLFVRTVLAREESETIKRDMIRYGIKALSGEEQISK